jgi:hypothetical protein
VADALTKRELNRRRRNYILTWILLTLLGLFFLIIVDRFAYSYFPSGIAIIVFWGLLLASEIPIALVWERKIKKPYDQWRRTHEPTFNTDNDETKI